MERSLSQIVTEFRDRYHLSKAKAGQVLGVSTLYVRSLEEGVDVRTGLPFNPREATIRQLAAKMTEFGYPVTFEELMVAAGKLPQEAVDFHQDKAHEPTDEDLERGELAIPGLDDLAAESDAHWNELTPDEKRQVRGALAIAAKAVIAAIMSGKKQRKLE